ncbi:MAG TPA: chorismate synthase [Candidatus Egerieousia sp.]|nr:chorismate synthase [Candidatus Egerieousia sp.]
MNSYGRKFRLSVFGESHGTMVGVTMDGVPAGMPLKESDFSMDLKRRKSGGIGTTLRREDDTPLIVSGVYHNTTTGAPLTIVFRNQNTNLSDYEKIKEWPRPGHADFVAMKKFCGFNDIRGGGHFSGRMTLCLVAAGVVAKKMLATDNFEGSKPVKTTKKHAISISAKLTAIGGEADDKKWETLIKEAIKEGDSLGGLIECICSNVPVGLGQPFFDSLESQISHLIFSIPATRGIEFGDGFKAAEMKGSQHNDCIIDKNGKTKTNGAGGINGGISNGNPIVFKVAIKPTSSICKYQKSFDFVTGKVEEYSIRGRHDCCIALRCPVIIEAAAAIALVNA